ncbi:WXG100 family type VII secretion target [Nonomuraea gerenzanensis]|uniref:Uncharacterized protein n=1 Tax=Nonomuraea gerenzanensis TaxID=93944 RepID=A0A1M4E0H5_9ACTN|nr:hypothetical protein [Nonomuraea gerenzanensis]UBU14599.1 hypothetical protein LCN96_06110 [Nonomuraea gerenzanensis]SBO92317.1 hypothetical protein BN4615_P1831 [Nonomuraea gerenzanensis]
MVGTGSDRGQFIYAATTATAAAAMLYEYPMARNIALMIGTMVSNPHSMQLAAERWSQPEGGGDMDFAGIKQAVRTLRDECNEKEWWKGPACEAFNQSVDTFLEQMDKAEQYHQGVGQGMGSIANAYHWAAEVVTVVATVMLLLAGWNKLKPLFAPWPGAAAAIALAIFVTLTRMGMVVRGMLGKQMKSVAMLTAVVAGINFMCMSLGQFIEQSRPRPDFAPAAVEYVGDDSTGVGTLQPKNGGMPTMPTTGAGGMSAFV